MSKIFILDDESGIRDLCYDLFTRDGHEVMTAFSGDKLIELMARQKPDLILMDLNLSGESGISILKRIMGQSNTAVPVVLFSGYISPEIEKEAFEAGAVEVLAKGLSIQELQTKVYKILEAKTISVPPKPQGENEQILVVDDEESIRTLLQRFFEKKGFKTLLAQNGEEALKIVAEKRPAMILLDVTMPGMDGILTLKKIREIDPQAGVVMATGAQDEQVVREATALGAYAYVFKPFDLRYLELVVLTRLVMSS